MQKAYGSTYVRVRPYGALGDKGCDGYRADTGAVHQCYAPNQPATASVSTLVNKMRDDFAKAVAALDDIMKSWVFTHNMMRGLPVEAIQEAQKLKDGKLGIGVTFFGPEAIESLVLSLDEQKIEDLIGLAASAADYSAPNVVELAAMLQNVAERGAPPEGVEIKPVPLEKVSYNNLSDDCAKLIGLGMLNEPVVEDYLRNSSDATLGDRIAQALRDEYRALHTQGFAPDDIFGFLLAFVLGKNRVKNPSPAEQVAAQAILSFFFHTCDVFEDVPTEAADADAAPH